VGGGYDSSDSDFLAPNPPDAFSVHFCPASALWRGPRCALIATGLDGSIPKWIGFLPGAAGDASLMTTKTYRPGPHNLPASRRQKTGTGLFMERGGGDRKAASMSGVDCGTFWVRPTGGSAPILGFLAVPAGLGLSDLYGMSVATVEIALRLPSCRNVTRHPGNARGSTGPTTERQGTSWASVWQAGVGFSRLLGYVDAAFVQPKLTG